MPPVIHRVYFLREHHLHGIVTGIEAVRVMSSVEDGLDRLLVSFKDAKVCGWCMNGNQVLKTIR